MTSIAMIFGASSRMSSRPCTQTIASSPSSSPYCAIVFGKTITSTAAPRSSSTNVAMRSPRFVYFFGSAVTTPPTVRSSPSRISLRSLSVASVWRRSARSAPISGWSDT